jgi:hypothetical protein
MRPVSSPSLPRTHPLSLALSRARTLSSIGSGGRPQGWQAAIYDRDTASAERRREPLLRGP